MMPVATPPTGMKKRWRNGFFQALRKQQVGIVIAPIVKAIAAGRAQPVATPATWWLMAKKKLMKPSL